MGVARTLAEALVAGGPAQRADDGFVGAPGVVDAATGPAGRYQRADTRSGLLQLAALYDAATRGLLRRLDSMRVTRRSIG
jgi:hypothetical protein